MDIIQTNKFSKLHNGNTVFFCKTDFLLEDFKTIENIPYDVILISGNSDYIINEKYLNFLPKNVKTWYAVNAMINTDIIKTLPLGIENLNFCDREGHGIGYDRVNTKIQLIENLNRDIPNKFIYANFTIQNNIPHRSDIYKKCVESSHIDWENSNLSLENYFKKITEYEAIVCPDGNGPDTHRFYEVLYMGRIPIVFNRILYKNLHYKFPCVLLDSTNELLNKTLLEKKINEVKTKEWDLSILETKFWINEILK